MFKKSEVSVGAWLMFFILMAIPIVNIIVYLILMFGSKTNKTMKHMLWAMTLPVIVIIVIYVLGFTFNPFVYLP